VPEAQRLGRYELIEPIASGGMARIYRARFVGPHRYSQQVAVKLIHAHLAEDESFVKMFLDEVAIASRITHPNVCSVLDFGVHEGTYYSVLEYLRGAPLSRVFRVWVEQEIEAEARKERLLLLASVLADACDGLHAAHELRDERGRPLDVVHRDVSPSNVFVCFDGSVRVLDFGVASANRRFTTTTTGQVKGKLSYMAPEALLGETVDRRADVWAVGVILWEFLAGRRLFSRANPGETVRAVTDEPIPPLEGAAPLALEEIALRALCRDREMRFATAADLARELRGYMAAEVPAGEDRAAWLKQWFPEVSPAEGEAMSWSEPPETTLETAQSPVRRRATRRVTRRAWVLGVVGVLLALLGGRGLGLLALREVREPQGVDVAPPARVTEERDTPLVEEGPEVAEVGGSEVEAEIGGSEVEAEIGGSEVEAEIGGSEVEAEVGTARPAEEIADPVRPAMLARPRGDGTLLVTTAPCWSEVLVDGRPHGNTPSTLELPAGRHRVRLNPMGRGDTVRRTVRIRPNDTTRLSVQVECGP